MKKFKFRLENVLKVRNLHKKLAERQMAETQVRVNKNQEALDETKEAYYKSFHTMSSRTDNFAFWNAITSRYQEALVNRAEELVEKQSELDEKLAVEKNELARRMQDEMVIEKLKEYQKAEHLVQANAEEQLEIEEIDLLKRGGKK